jgi:RND family efflux transporter MFP subunit
VQLNKQMKKLILSLMFASLLLGCNQNEKTVAKSKLDKTPKVRIAKVNTKENTTLLNYSGSIEADQSIPLSFQSPGIIQKIYVSEGDFVKKDQLLAEVDKDNLKSAYDAALAQYNQAVDAKERLQKVYDNKSLPEIQWVEINSKLTQAKSMLDIATKNLKNCELHAPASGIIGSKNVEVGMSALQMQAPFTIVKIECVLVKISVPENEISTMKKGMKASISVSALNKRKYEGIVETVGVVANRFSRTYEVKINVDNHDGQLKPGMVCDVNFSLDEHAQIISVPMPSVMRDELGQTYVFTINKKTGLAKKKPVQLGGIHNNEHQVLSGLIEGEFIVIAGMHKIKNNTKVTF